LTIPGTNAFSRGNEGVGRARLAALLVLLMVAAMLVFSATATPTTASAGIDPRVPGDNNPVGPTNWNNMTTKSQFVNYDSGGNVTVSNVKFLNGFEINNGTHVTMRNCHVINPDSFWTVFVRNGSLVMEDCQIGDYTTKPGQRGAGGDDVTLRRVKIVGHSDGFKAGHNGLYEQVWVTDLREFQPDDHPDGMQDDGGNSNYTVRYSRLEGIGLNGERGTSAALIKSDLGPINNVTLENNAFDGGQYVLMVDKGNSYPAPSNVIIRNNAFGRRAVYGVLLRDDNAGITWENNFWEDTGKYIDENGNPTGGGTTPPPPTGGPFADVPSSHTFASDIAWLAKEGITKGCNPPSNTQYCPDGHVTRGQMAAFLVRALGLTKGGGTNRFTDDNGSVFETDINKIAKAGITQGCNPPSNTRFCPDSRVTRGQMAAFLVRALGLTKGGGTNRFIDDNGSVFETDINKIAKAGITKGCNPPSNTRFCPNSYVSRGQMAAFLRRAFA
jgi:hypothetical protein